MVQAQIIDLINNLRKKLKMSMIMITHDLSIITETCDNICVMYAGKVVETGATGVVVRRHLHPYTEKLITAFPNIYGARKMVDSIPGDPPDLYNPPPGCRFSARCHKVCGEICSTVEPELKDLGGGHRVACHLYDGEGNA
jgi:peptide/nickel transport system ATP-binding protein